MRLAASRLMLAVVWGLVGIGAAAADEPAALPPAPGGGDAMDGETPRLTVEDLQQMALQNNPTLDQARSETWNAHGRYVQAGLYPNPQLGYQASEIGGDGKAGQQGLYWQQEFVTGGKLRLSQAAAAYSQSQAEQALFAQEYRVANAVRGAFYEVLTAERKASLAKELLQIAREAEDNLRKQFELLQGSKIQVLQAQVERQQAELSYQTAEIERQAALRRLQAVVGAEIPALMLAGELEDNVPDLSWEETWNRLLEMSPVLARAQAGIGEAQMSWERARVEPIPNVTLQAGTQYDYSSNTQIANLQLSLPLPIFDRNQGNIASAEAQWVRASREVDRLKLQLKRTLAESYRNYDTNRIRVLRYSSSMIPASQESLELSRKSLEAGEIGYLQFLTAQRSYVTINQEYVAALGALWQDVVALDGLLLTDGLSAPETSD